MSMLFYYSSILIWTIISFCYEVDVVVGAVSFPNISILSSRGSSSISSTATAKPLLLASSTSVSTGIKEEIITTAEQLSKEEIPATKNKNIVFQLGGYVKDSLTRFKDGTIELYTNYQKCQTIRNKEKAFQTINYEDSDNNNNNIGIYKKRGITYHDYNFLQKQKLDRGKLGNMLFLLFFAPNIMPYSIMFFPDMLPSPFHPKSTTSLSTTNDMKYSSASRQISHAILKTLIDIEQLGSSDSSNKSSSKSLLPFGFGKKKAEQKVQQMKELLYLTTSFFGSGSSCTTNVPLLLHEDNDENSSKVTTTTPTVQILTKLHDQIYTSEKPTKDQTRFVTVPKPILKGISNLLPSSSAPSFLENFLPNFLIRNNILKHIQMIAEGDEFLINEDIDFTTIDNDSLKEICMDRCIVVSSSNDNDDTTVLHEKLANWLQFTVVQPRLYQYSPPQVVTSDSNNSTKVFPTASDFKKLKFEGISLLKSKTDNNEQSEQPRFEYYNGNVARLILLCNNAISSTIENRRTSILPRLLYTTTL